MKILAKNAVKAIVIILVVVGLFFLITKGFSITDIENVDLLKERLEGFGLLAPVVYILLMMMAVIVSPVPSLPLDVASGIIWGPFLGTVYSVIGAELGAIISFLIARFLGRRVLEKIFHRDITFCDHCSDRSMFLIIFVSRLFPVFHFDVISYGSGLTNISLKRFAIATFFGMIPATFLFAYTGRSILTAKYLSAVLAIVLIVAMFVVPMLIKKYNLFNLRDTLGKHKGEGKNEI